MVGYGDLSWINPEKNPKSNLQPWVHASYPNRPLGPSFKWEVVLASNPLVLGPM
jgi:hypothetical protein